MNSLWTSKPTVERQTPLFVSSSTKTPETNNSQRVAHLGEINIKTTPSREQSKTRSLQTMEIQQAYFSRKL